MHRRTYLGTTLALGSRLVLPSAVIVLGGCSGRTASASWHTLDGPTMGTFYRIRLTAPPEQRAVLDEAVPAILDRIVEQMSTYRPDSELARFNAARATDEMGISAETRIVVAEALRVGSLSDGAFDPTVGRLVDLWGFGPAGRRAALPSDEAIADAVDALGHAKLHLTARGTGIAKERTDVEVDLSGIAKGFAVDQVAEHLERLGIASYLIEIGGELRSRGRNPSAEPWRVGIERPVPGQRAVYRVVHLEDRAIATSGGYRNFFDRDGTRFSHTIDPRTGRPVSHSLASVSVIADSTMVADAMSTAILVMGPDEGYAFARERGLAAYLISRSADGLEERWTPEFTRYRAS